MRLELNMLAHFDAHFLSDTVNPVDTLRILQGTLLRLPPGRLAHWTVLRSAGSRIPWYSDPMARFLAGYDNNAEQSRLAAIHIDRCGFCPPGGSTGRLWIERRPGQPARRGLPPPALGGRLL